MTGDGSDYGNDRSGRLISVDFRARTAAQNGTGFLAISSQELEDIVPLYVAEAEVQNQKDEGTNNPQMLGGQDILTISPLYLLLLPPRSGEAVRLIDGVHLPVSYRDPLAIQGKHKKEYGLFCGWKHNGKQLQVASPGNQLEELLSTLGLQGQNLDVVVITSATPDHWKQSSRRNIIYLPNIHAIESVHPASVGLQLRVGYIQVQGNGNYGAYTLNHSNLLVYNGKIDGL